jgi:hypothetical protein
MKEDREDKFLLMRSPAVIDFPIFQSPCVVYFTSVHLDQSIGTGSGVRDSVVACWVGDARSPSQG